MSAELGEEITITLGKERKENEPPAISELRRDGMIEKLRALNSKRDDIQQLVSEVIAIVVELTG